MNSVDEQVYNQVKNVGMKTAKLAANSSIELWKLVLNLLIEKQQKRVLEEKINSGGEVALKELYSGVNKEGCSLMNIKIPDEDIEQFKNCMKSNGVLYTVTDLKNDDLKMVLYLDRDSDKMADSIKLYYASKGLINELNPDLFMKSHRKQNIGVVENISPVDLELFRHYSKESNIIYTTYPENEGKTYKILYPEKYAAKVKNAIEKVSIDLSGTQGPLVKEHLEYRIKGRQQINIAIQDAEREYYIVNGKNPKNYVELTSDGFTYYKNNKAVTSLNRSNPEFMKGTYSNIEKLGEPILLTKDEFNLPDKERWQILNAATSIYPVGYNIDLEQIKGASVGTPELSHLRESELYQEKFVHKEIVIDDTKSLAFQLEKARERSLEENRDNPIKQHSLGR